jgi:hypothetical protein
MGHRYTVNGTILPYEVVEDVRSAFDGSQKQLPSEEFGEDVESVKDRASGIIWHENSQKHSTDLRGLHK